MRNGGESVGSQSPLLHFNGIESLSIGSFLSREDYDLFCSISKEDRTNFPGTFDP